MTKQMPDPYAVLGVAPDADDRQVRDAYRRLAKRYHPDLHPEANMSERMRRVNEAWHVLSDPGRRARHDAAHATPARRSDGDRSASSRRAPGPGPGGMRGPAWATSASHTGRGSSAGGWGSSSWTSGPRARPSSRVGAASAGGPPIVAVLAILVVGWLAIGGVLGGFLLPGVLGVLTLLAARWILAEGADR